MAAIPLLSAFLALLPAPQSTFEVEIESVLGSLGLTKATARFDENLLRLFRQGEFTPPLYDAASENPWRMPFFADTFRRELAGASGRPNEQLNLGLRFVGFGTRRTLIGNPIAAEEDRAKREGALRAILDEMAARAQITKPIPDLGEVPPAVQEAAAILLAVLPSVLELRRAALVELGDLNRAFELLAEPDSGTVTAFDERLRVVRKIDLRYLGAGGHDLLLAVQTAASKLTAVPSSARYEFEVETTLGFIRLSGGSPNAHPNRPTLLVIDTGGSDVYHNLPATQSAQNGVSVVIDTDGNDRYLSDPALESTSVERFEGRRNPRNDPGPGGALMGYTVLADAKGNDLYRSHRPGLGSGRFGVAALLDRDGADHYDAYRDAQGFGMFGAGILEDLAGDDRYLGFNQVQGMGQTMGFGYLADRAGKDEYLANLATIDFPSAQSAQHNVHMAQGAGNGRRGDYLDGHSLSGGVGVLHEGGGDDRYQCAVFGQGVGYWKAVGMLWDEAGDDAYEGQWYAQGASAHFAIGYLEDFSGNDRYTAPMNMAQGAGHDFSLGVLIDRAGDDQYRAPNLSLGAGNANGIGLFVDADGADFYVGTGVTLGRAAESPAGSLRMRALCLGVFLDLGGTDTYPNGISGAANGTQTTHITASGPSPWESQLGVFWDK